MDVFYHDSLTLFLVGLVLCMLGGDRSLTRALWACVRSRSKGACEGPLLERVCALGLTALALLVHQSDLTVVLLALVLGVIGGRAGNIFLPLWGLPALVLYGVFPSTWGAILLLPVLFWPGQRQETVADQRCIGIVLAIGLASHALPFQPGIWMLGAGGVVLALSAWGYLQHWRALSGMALILRPLLLLGVVAVAHNEGLGASAYAAMSALLLDVSLCVVNVVKPSWRVLGLAVPPLPGFVVMWLGVHATLGITTGASGWTIAGIGVAVVLALLSVLEVVRSLPNMPKTRLTVPFLATATLLPIAVTLFANGVASYGLEGGTGRPLYETIWLFHGGDGAVLAFPAIWGLLLFVWSVLVRPWSLATSVTFPHKITISLVDQQRWLAWLVGDTPRLPWRWRRYGVVLRWYGRELHGRFCQLYVPFSEISLTIWLVFLGGVLAVLGLTS